MQKKVLYMLAFLLLGVGWASAQVSSVTGTVTSADDGEPVIGASVLVKGTTTGTVTDIDGNFTLSVPAGIIRKTICPKSQNDLSEDWGDTTAFFGRVVFGWFVYP